MKKKLLVVLMAIVAGASLVGCATVKEENNEDALKFKEEYESLNGTTNDAGKENRTVSISEDNPFVYISQEDLVKKIDNDETFYVYFGDTKCPWCRSVIEKAIEVAKENKIDKIYYVNIWDEDHNEILRDKYSVDEKGKLTKENDGSLYYSELLMAFENLLSDYTLTYTNSKGKEKTVEVGEKRIYAPNFIYVEKGEGIQLESGISELQSDSRGELTEEILAEEETAFNSLFKR